MLTQVDHFGISESDFAPAFSPGA